MDSLVFCQEETRQNDLVFMNCFESIIPSIVSIMVIFSTYHFCSQNW